MRDKKIDYASRKSYLDLLRIIAILFVIYVHTDQRGYIYYVVTQNKLLKYIIAMLSSISSSVNPLFFMISGAVLIPKKEKISEIFKRRIARCLIAIVIGSFINYLFRLGWDFSKVDLLLFFKTIYSGQIVGTYWFLYTYLAYLLLLPIIRKMAMILKGKDYLYIILLILAVNSLSVVEWIFWKGDLRYNKYFTLFISTIYLIYPLLGYYLDRLTKISHQNKNTNAVIRFINKNPLTMLITISLLLSLLSSHLAISEFNVTGNEWGTDFLSTYSIVFAITIFWGAKIFFSKRRISNGWKKLFGYWGGCSFGIMLIDHICSTITYPIYEGLVKVIRYWPAACVHVLLQWIIGVVIITICKQLPFMRKLL